MRQSTHTTERENPAILPVTSQRLSLSLRICKDGVPSFSCSRNSVKGRLEADRGFLWVGEMPEQTSHTDTDAWWQQFRQKAWDDARHWEDVQEAMAQFSCVLEITSKLGTGWAVVAPRQANARSVTGPTQKATKWANDASKRYSSLRNEVGRD